MLRSSPTSPPRRRATAFAVVLVLASPGLVACGGSDEKKKPAGPHLTAAQNKGIAAIGRTVSEYCFKGGSVTNIRRDIQSLLIAYREHPTALFRAPDGTESRMRVVVTAVADQLESCGEVTEAKPLRKELRRAG